MGEVIHIHERNPWAKLPKTELDRRLRLMRRDGRPYPHALQVEVWRLHVLRIEKERMALIEEILTEPERP